MLRTELTRERRLQSVALEIFTERIKNTGDGMTVRHHIEVAFHDAEQFIAVCEEREEALPLSRQFTLTALMTAEPVVRFLQSFGTGDRRRLS